VEDLTPSVYNSSPANSPPGQHAITGPLSPEKPQMPTCLSVVANTTRPLATVTPVQTSGAVTFFCPGEYISLAMTPSSAKAPHRPPVGVSSSRSPPAKYEYNHRDDRRQRVN